MVERAKQIVARVARNPALVRLLRDDPAEFARRLSVTDAEVRALQIAGALMKETSRRFTARRTRLLTPRPASAACKPRNLSAPGGASGLPVMSILAIAGMCATVATVAVVALIADE